LSILRPLDQLPDVPPTLQTALSDRYRLERELGQGGMATVYLAQDLKHDRKVAIKVLRPELAAVIGAERFLAEIKTTANLQHPHILPLFDSGAARLNHPEQSEGPQDFLFYVMPYVEGESLRDRLNREKQLPIPDAVRLATEVAGALEHAHRHGVIHRDIKPENILLREGAALVADFGIALAASKAGGSRMTETGMSLGTPQYMSPEQAMGQRELDARSDIYALGAMTYECLTGEPPFSGPTAQAIVAKVMTAAPEPVTNLRRTVPPNVAAAVHQAIEKLPADRFATAAEFASALRSEHFVSATSARPAAAPGPSRRFSALLGAITVISLGIAGWALMRGAASRAPLVFDAGLPDSAPMTFAATTATTGFGIPIRNLGVSPAGDFVVYTASQGDSTLLWFRSLRDASVRPIVGTLGATAPRISPDGSRVAFIVSNRVLVVPVAGGEPRLLLEGQVPVALEWISPTLLLVTHFDGARLSWVDPEGGQTQVKGIPACRFGQWTPEARQLICTVNGTGSVVDPASGGQWTIRARNPDGSPGTPVSGSAFRLVEGHYLAYVSVEGDLRAAPYDRGSHLAGRSVTLVPGVRREALGDAQYDLAGDGVLVYAPGANAEVGRLVQLRRGGTPEPLPLEAAAFLRYDRSRDGRWLAAVVQTIEGQELRVYDLRDGQRLTWLRAELIRHALWSPGGDRLVVWMLDSTRSSILIGTPSSGARPDTLYGADAPATALDPIDFHDDRNVLVQNWANERSVLRMDLTSRPVRFDTVATGAAFTSISPDGRHLAYLAPQDNRIMVTSYPDGGRRTQIASDGAEPLWLSATELLYRKGVSWYLARLDPTTGAPVGAATFWGRDPRFSDTPGWSNRLSHDGGIIYEQGPEQTSAPYLRVVPNWVSQMKAAVDQANR